MALHFTQNQTAKIQNSILLHLKCCLWSSEYTTYCLRRSDLVRLWKDQVFFKNLTQHQWFFKNHGWTCLTLMEPWYSGADNSTLINYVTTGDTGSYHRFTREFTANADRHHYMMRYFQCDVDANVSVSLTISGCIQGGGYSNDHFRIFQISQDSQDGYSMAPWRDIPRICVEDLRVWAQKVL